jgi:hypothetical protein
MAVAVVSLDPGVALFSCSRIFAPVPPGSVFLPFLTRKGVYPIVLAKISVRKPARDERDYVRVPK